MSHKNTLVLYLCVLLALVGYMLPWIVTPTAPLTLGAYDLAEWTSLHPSQLYTTPVLIVPLLLRIQLVIITLIIALAVQPKLRIVAIIAIIPLSIAQFPPLEFLTVATNDVNYQQQFILATFSLIAGLVTAVFRPARFVPHILIVLVGIGVVTAGVGLQQAQNLYTMSLQENSIGMGIMVLYLAYLTIILIQLQSLQLKLSFNSLRR